MCVIVGRRLRIAMYALQKYSVCLLSNQKVADIKKLIQNLTYIDKLNYVKK